MSQTMADLDTLPDATAGDIAVSKLERERLL
jgi:hypothetical protein